MTSETGPPLKASQVSPVSTSWPLLSGAPLIELVNSSSDSADAVLSASARLAVICASDDSPSPTPPLQPRARPSDAASRPPNLAKAWGWQAESGQPTRPRRTRPAAPSARHGGVAIRARGWRRPGQRQGQGRPHRHRARDRVDQREGLPQFGDRVAAGDQAARAGAGGAAPRALPGASPRQRCARQARPMTPATSRPLPSIRLAVQP